jgi:hypothetical protein
MSFETLLQVAIEMDYPESIVRHTLRRHQFENAGQLIDFLEDNMSNLQQEVQVEEEEEEKSCHNVTSNAAESKLKELSLKEETELLYRLSFCLKCWKNPRTLVILPCSHFALCDSCGKTARTCPRRDCQAYIECIIHTYGL